MVTARRRRTLEAVSGSPDRATAAADEQADVNQRPYRLVICSRTPAVRAGLRALLARSGFEVLDELAPEELLDGVPLGADVVVVELGGDEGELRSAFDGELRDVPAVLLVDGRAGAPRAGRAWLASDASEAALAGAVSAVAAGLSVADPELGPAMFEVSSDDSDGELVALTEREDDVLKLLAAGLPNKGIARDLGISEHTVKYHVGSLLSKLDAQSRTEAVTIAARRGLLTL
jgi:two-component system, NarL family, nitrate/nitrite response regulator NarL